MWAETWQETLLVLKRTIVFVASLLFVGISTLAQSQFKYTTNSDNTLTITGYTGPSGAVTIPSAINGMTVSGAGPEVFGFFKTNVTSLTIPGTVTNFATYAFAFLFGLTNLTIEQGIFNLPDEVFTYCPVLTTVALPGSLTNIGIGVFASCYNLRNIQLPSSVVSIGTQAFNLTGLTNLTIPGTVETLSSTAFSGCVSLTNLIVEEGVSNIGEGAFLQCSNLTSVSIAGSVTNIGDSAFYQCVSLSNVIFMNGVCSIGNQTFEDCNQLSSIIIPGSVTNIGEYCFEGSGLTNLTVRGSPVIGYKAFFQGLLQNVYLAGGEVGPYSFWSCANLTNLSLGSNVTAIGYNSFSQAPISSLSIPGSVTNIDDLAFAYCELTNVTWASTNLTLGGYVFVQNPFTNVSLPAGVRIAGDQVFMECSNLENVVIGAGVPYLTYGMFSVCAHLTNVLCLGNAPAVDGVYSSDGSVFLGDTNVTIYYRPDTTGWGSTYGSAGGFSGAPTALWNPVIETGDGSFGVNNGQFGFDIKGTPDIPIVIQACTDLANPVWTNAQACTLTNGLIYFSDPAWASSPTRYYTLAFP
jgi:hypothetical protein